ncbi:nucleobindin-2-like isoform X2 [Portunus trituberculatus]|uniref:nucleobindin-2-like isoform X2 n=1 Tax=Portunus trituberculatus TaxID=210409 RepID=UPI001E1CC8CA|nr:nucleobindin-2-like isoform X2 [Portunus trituberculatus]
MRQWQIAVLLVAVGVVVTKALPVKDKKPTPEEEKKAAEAHEGDGTDDWELNLEYGRYLKEVVQALESDQAFRKKLETAEVDDIKSGKIARELHFVDHNVRTKLDELKRRELERLRHLAVKEHEKEAGVDRSLLKVPVHIDHRNPTRFEVEDLKKLIVKTTEDLEKVDQERKKEFKKYEMEKEYLRQEEMQSMDDSHRKEVEEKHQQEIKQHKQHEKLHHPGSKQQLEEVWEEQDHMQPEDFDPKTFFHLHDLDGNGYWDQTEVKALFKKELDKMYDPNAPEDDMMERYEEMERMREHVFQESDLNRDNLISFKEFVDQTKRADFEQDNGWQGLDEEELYSQQEYEEYQRQRHEEIQRLVEAGAIPPPPGYHGAPAIQPAVYQGGPHPGLAHPNTLQQGYQAVPQVYQAVPQGYQAVPQGYQVVPQGYQAVPQGYQAVPQSHQAPPQGYQAVPQQDPNQLAQQGQAHPAQIQVGQVPPAQAQQAHPAQAQQAHPAQVQQVQPGLVQQAQPAQVQQAQPPQAVNAQQGLPAQQHPGQVQGVPGQVAHSQHPDLKAPVAGQVPQPPQPVAGQGVAAHPSQPAAVHH